VTQTKASQTPCMDPFYQTSQGFYQLELMQYTFCPPDVNSGLTYDPRYTQFSAFSTTEYQVQQSSGVLQLLEGLPGYFNPVNVPNPYVK